MEQREQKEKFTVPMSQVLEELFEEQDRITERPREYVLEGIPNSKELQKLSSLPFEVLIVVVKSRLVLSTRSFTTVDMPIHDSEFASGIVASDKYRTMASPVNFHSHPALPEVLYNYPSPADYGQFLLNQMMSVSSDISHDKACLIGTQGGLIVIKMTKELAPMTLLDLSKEMGVFHQEAEKGSVTEEEYAFMIEEKTKPFCSTEYISWDQAQPVIDQHMNPVNLSGT